jgi:hypothetical protein
MRDLIRRATVVAGASALVAAMAFTLPAATAASHASSPPPVGTVRVTGSLRVDPSLHYRTALARPRTLTASTVTSSNWSGYEVSANSGQTIKRIQGLFSIPNVDCARSTLGTSGQALWSDWVGLDGFTTSTVEQIGVAAECTTTTGPATYFAFYEMFPSPGVTLTGTGVNPGDAIVVVVQKVSTGWQLVLQDRTTGASVATVQTCPAGSTCRDASGEAITEDYNTSVPQHNLADFGISNQTDLLATSGSGRNGGLGSGSLWTSHTIDMANPANNHRMATPGPLYGGEAFYLTWNASS